MPTLYNKIGEEVARLVGSRSWHIPRPGNLAQKYACIVQQNNKECERLHRECQGCLVADPGRRQCLHKTQSPTQKHAMWTIATCLAEECRNLHGLVFAYLGRDRGETSVAHPRQSRRAACLQRAMNRSVLNSSKLPLLVLAHLGG
jgi:hypothetical protein